MMDPKDLLRGGLMGLTTDVVGTPVDLMSMILYQLGYKEPKPVMGSEWLAEKLGVRQTGSVPEQAARLATGLLSPGPGELAQIGPLMGAIKAYHGSPHKFDKFDLSKIGTGEGAQAYGHGAYLAENPGVAMDYKKRLAGKVDQDAYWSNVPLPPSLSKSEWDELATLGQKMRKNGNLPKDEMSRWRTLHDKETKYSDAVKANEPTGHLYETSLRWPDPAREAADPLGPQHFLDWDKPISEQQHILNKLPGGKYVIPQKSGADIYVDLSSPSHYPGPLGARGSEQAASEYLKQQGIPGIRYLDAGSRGAGQGTANYVVFDDAMIEILKRNGLDIK